MTSVNNLLTAEIVPGEGIGELTLGLTIEGIKRIFPDFDESTNEFNRSIKLHFSELGYLERIVLQDNFAGKLYGYIGIGSSFMELTENFCKLQQDEWELYEVGYELSPFRVHIFNENLPEKNLGLFFDKKVPVDGITQAKVKKIVLWRE